MAAVEQALADLNRINSVAGLLEFSRDHSVRLGVVRQSYHFTPMFHQPTSARTIVQAEGFSQEWLALYAAQDFRACDPIPARTLRHGARLSWQDAMTLGENSSDNQRFFAAMADHGLVHGFGLPLFGPRGRDAYASFDFGRPLADVDAEIIESICGVAQAGHVRVCNLIEQGRDVPVLSTREREVMKWIARGKSNTDIGTILDISPETVRTYVQRIYQKLGTHDRIAAAIRALKLGLIEL